MRSDPHDVLLEGSIGRHHPGHQTHAGDFGGARRPALREPPHFPVPYELGGRVRPFLGGAFIPSLLFHVSPYRQVTPAHRIAPRAIAPARPGSARAAPIHSPNEPRSAVEPAERHRRAARSPVYPRRTGGS